MAAALPHRSGASPRVAHLSALAPTRGGRIALVWRALGRFGLLLGFVIAITEGHALAQTATPRVEAVYPHDTTAFTQGLELFEGKLFESTGLTGRSTLRRVAVTTGVVETNLNLDASLFAEGLTRIDRTLIQLTYTTGIAIVYNLDTFAELKRFTYTGEGWGLCYDGTDLVMTNGSDKLFFRDPATFAVRREITVQRSGAAIDMLNELECVGSLVYVNQWRTDNILRVDKATGNVMTVIDASALLTADEKRNADVLNGIAYDEAKRRFYLTGKLWPKLFEVSFDFDPGGAGDAGVDAGVVDARGGDTGGTVDASRPSDASRDVANDTTMIDVASPRDTGTSRDGPDGSARDATSNDTVRIDAGAPIADVAKPPDDVDGRAGAAGAADAGGVGGVGGTGGTSGSGAAGDAGGNDASDEGCACRAGGALSRGSLPALGLLLGAAALAWRLRRGARRD
jgi:glutaminyl-peptide cyclotransferase